LLRHGKERWNFSQWEKSIQESQQCACEDLHGLWEALHVAQEVGEVLGRGHNVQPPL
jgi:hypothetical protein